VGRRGRRAGPALARKLRRFPAGSPPAAVHAPWRRRVGDGECDDRRRPIELDERRGMAAQTATCWSRLLAQVEANEHALRLRRDELEAHLIAAPAANWPEAAEKARYALGALRGHRGRRGYRAPHAGGCRAAGLRAPRPRGVRREKAKVTVQALLKAKPDARMSTMIDQSSHSDYVRLLEQGFRLAGMPE
jgi:hypothetical protein